MYSQIFELKYQEVEIKWYKCVKTYIETVLSVAIHLLNFNVCLNLLVIKSNKPNNYEIYKLLANIYLLELVYILLTQIYIFDC